MHRRSGLHLPCLVAAAVALAGVACGNTSDGLDFGPEGDATDDGTVGGFQLTIVNPTEGKETRVSGTVDVSIRVDDDVKEPISLRIEVLKAGALTPIVKELSGPGTVNVSIDTTKIPDGRKWTLQVTASASENLMIKTAQLTVDNQAPSIEAKDPTPPEGGNFLGDLVLRFQVQDAGSGIASLTISVDSFSYSWPGSGSPTKVDTGAISVPASALTSGSKTVKVEAKDGLDRVTTFQRAFSYSQRPTFQAGSGYLLPDDEKGSAIAGIRLADGTGAVVVAGYPALVVYTRNAASNSLAKRAELAKGVTCNGVQVRDLNGDSRDDVIASCPGWLTDIDNAIVIYLQSENSTFGKPQVIVAPSPVRSFALGDVNNDLRPDVAMAMPDAAGSLGISLSDITDDTWGGVRQYSGAQQPGYVAIGRWASVSESNPYKNSILLARDGSKITTIFSMDTNGAPSSGVNGVLDSPGLSALVATNFKDPAADPDVLVVGDVNSGRVTTAFPPAESSPSLQIGTYRNRGLDLYSTGVNPRRIVAGDLDGDGTNDVAVLCEGSDLVHVFRGNGSAVRDKDYADFLIDGPALLTGPATDLALADLDGAATDAVRTLDLVVLAEGGASLIFIPYDKDTHLYGGTPVVLSPLEPVSLAAGKFTKRGTGAAQYNRDVALLGQDDNGADTLAFWVSDDGASNLPLVPAQPRFHQPLPNQRRIVAADLDYYNQQTKSSPTDLVLTSARTGPAGTKPATAQALVFGIFGETGAPGDPHTNVTFMTTDIYAGEAPILAAAGDLYWTNTPVAKDVSDPIWRDVELGYQDLAFVAGYYATGGVRNQNLQGFFRDPKVPASYAVLQAPGSRATVLVGDAKRPAALIAYPIRRSLTKALTKTPYFLDLLTANSGTGDFSVYTNQGSGKLQTVDRVRDFALGANARAIAAGYLSVPFDPDHPDVVPEDVALKTYPDVVTLTDQDVMISFNTSDSAQLKEEPWMVQFSPPQPLGYTGKGPVDVAIVDMNHDTFMDIVVLDSEDSAVTIYMNLGAKTFSQPFSFQTGVGPVAMAIADLDGNECPDVVTADAAGRTLTFLRSMIPCSE